MVTMSDFRTIRKKKKLAVYFIVVCAYINVIKHNLIALTGKTDFEKALGNQLSRDPLLVNMIQYW